MPQAEVPGALWVPADRSNYGLRPLHVVGYNLVVIHITSGRGEAQAVADMWSEPDHGSSAHFVIGQDGTAIQCVPLRFMAYHAHGANGRSVGIEHCAREPNEPSFPKGDPGLLPTDVQYAKSAKIVAYLLKAAGMEPIRGYTIMGHKEADPKTTHDRCPDGAWDWDKYLPMVKAAWDQLGDPPALV